MDTKAVISGDLIAFTSLYENDRIKVSETLKKLLSDLKLKYSGFNRIIKGDYIEYYLDDPRDALRTALAIKCFIKSIELDGNYPKNSRVKLFRNYGIRLAVGIGGISRYDPENGIIDGEAIYFSGRIISEVSVKSEGKNFIKETFFVKASDSAVTERLEPLFALLDHLLSKNTSRQSRVLYSKLMGLNEAEIAAELGVLQPTVNQHSTSAGWNAVEKAVINFETTINFSGAK